MYERFMTIIEENREKIIKNVEGEILKRDETAHYADLTEDAREERIAQVVKNVHVRLGNWLNKNKPKNTLFAYYSELGAKRCREGMPLDETVLVFQFIKRAIWHELRDQIAINNAFTLNQFMEINYYVNLFFDRIVHATVAGYIGELGNIIPAPVKEKLLMANLLKR